MPQNLPGHRPRRLCSDLTPFIEVYVEKTCRLVHITYRENNRGPCREKNAQELNYSSKQPHIACTAYFRYSEIK